MMDQLDREEDETETDDLALTLAAIERDHVRAVLEDMDWNISETARILRVDRGTVYNKIKQYGLERNEASGGAEVGQDR